MNGNLCMSCARLRTTPLLCTFDAFMCTLFYSAILNIVSIIFMSVAAIYEPSFLSNALFLLSISNSYDFKLKLSLSLKQCLLYSVLYHFKYALTWPPIVTMLACYFKKRWPVSKALASAGEWIVTFLFTPFLQFPVDHYSWRGAMLVLGAVQLHLCVWGGTLLRPLTVICDELSTDPGRLELQSLSQIYHEPQEAPDQSPDSQVKSLPVNQKS